MALSQTTSNEVFTRDGWKCRHCGWTDGLHPHHVIYKSHGRNDRLNNLITLCFQCHIIGVHGGNLILDILEVLEQDVKVKFTRLKGWKPV